MKKRTVYWLPKINTAVILAALFMAISAVLRIIWAWGENLTAPTFWFQVALPLLANISFIMILFRDGKDRLYRSAIPVWLGCVFFAEKALGFDSMLHTVLCLCLYVLVAVLYTATVTGHVPTNKPLWLLFGLPMIYHVVVEDTRKAGWPLHDWLPELSVLCCMAALLCVSVAMQKCPLKEGAYAKRFGDRNDGRRLRSLSPIFAVSPYLMKHRNGANNLIEDHIDIGEVEKYVMEKRRAGMKNFGILHVLLAAYVRTCARYPGLNRFISGQKIYTRDGEIEVNMTIKKEMTREAPDSVIKVEFTPADTPTDVYEKFSAKVQEVKDAPEDTTFDSLVGIFNLVPGLLLKFLVFVLEIMDYFGLLPRFLTKLSPFHGSLYVTSMASLGIPAIFHHLYDFGNVPVFCAMGKKRREYEVQKDGTVVRKKYIDCNFVTDERIVDGYYFASALRYLHGLMSDPWQLDTPAETIVPDQY